MYLKLAIRNMRRSILDYAIFFITIMLTVAMFYSFFALAYSETIRMLSDNFSEFPKILFVFSVFIAAVAEFVVKYAVRYYLYEDKEVPDVEILCLSDYNNLRKQLGLEPKQIGEQQYIVHCEEWFDLEAVKKKVEDNPVLEIGGNSFTSSGSLVYSEPLEQMWMSGIDGQAFVLPDTMKEVLETQRSRLVVSSYGEVPNSLKNELEEFLNQKWNYHIESAKDMEHIFLGVIVKSWSVANSLGGYTMISFSGLYLSIAFAILTGTIMAFGKLSRADQDKKQFQILERLGVSEKDRLTELFSELAMHFLFPIVLPIIIVLIMAQILTVKYGEYRNLGLKCFLEIRIFCVIRKKLLNLITKSIKNGLSYNCSGDKSFVECQMSKNKMEIYGFYCRILL